MKRLVSLLLVFSMMLTLIPATVFAAPDSEVSVELANPFTDVKESDWFYDAVQYARINGFFNGTSETTFSPNGTMTRGMFVTVLGRMAGVDTAAYKGQAPFKDVPANMYYAPYVAWAAKHGVTSGMGDGTFVPDGLINREQMATFFVRYFENFDVDYETEENITTTPADMNKVSSWAKDAVTKLWKQGLLNGDGTNFNPTDDATRAQTATIAQRTDEVVETWYKEPGVASDRVKINPETGLPYGAEEKEEPKKPTTNHKLIGGGGSNKYSVKFYDGDTLIDTLYAVRNQPLGGVPEVEKSSKINAILLGYYLDPEFTQPFYADEPVTGNIKVYAKYEEMGSTEELNFTSFAQMDQNPDVTFEVVGSGNPETAVTLEVKDGSDPVALSFEATADGYIVSAPAGFNKGASYQLHLADGWTFKDKPDTIRTASFSIAMEEVENLEMSDEIKYIQDTDAIDYEVNGEDYDVLTQSLITENGGTFSYDGGDLSAGNIVCLYVGVHPEERVGNSDVLDPAVYVAVDSISGDTVEFRSLNEEEQKKLYRVPNNFPIKVSALPTATTGTVNINDLDEEMYALLLTSDYDLEKAKELIEVGDFVSLYVSKEILETNPEGNLYFGEITAYNASTGEITYKQTTEQAITESMDLFADIDLEGDDFISEEKQEQIEQVLLAQVEQSGFAEEAAFMLADMVTETDGFKTNKGIQDFVVKDSDGNVLSDEQLELFNLGGSFELSDDIELTVELITKGEQLHFNGGVQLAVGIEAEFEVELESEDKITIELSATFVQEVFVNPKIKGSIAKRSVWGVPVPLGVNISAAIDVKNYTAFSFEAVIYTVEAENELGWDAFKEKANKFIKDAGIQIPDELKEGISTVKDLVNKAKELEEMAQEAQGNYNQAMAYLEDAQILWSALSASGLSSKEDWQALEESFGATNICSDMLEMMNLTTETGLSTEYYDSVQALIDRYCEMLEQESDWVTLVEKEMFKQEVCYFGLVIGMEVNFVVRADLSLAIGSNLEYEVGKRYTFWFEIGLFEPTAGSSTMDLLDEKFAFQFYVMGRLGLRAGIQAEFYFGIGTGDLASVGIYAELGPYVKIYGFFVYEYTKYRPANTNNWISDERMMGAMFFEFGLYFILGFEAEALGLFEYSYDFLDEEIPLLTFGEKQYYYDFAFEPAEDEVIVVKDENNNSADGITMELPSSLMGMNYVNLTTGIQAVQALGYDKYYFNVSNPNFDFNKETGIITVNVPEGTQYMECDLTATYKYGKMAFSTYDMSVTIPLVWTNLSTDELNQYYTASVRVGNVEDGFETVWTKRVLKNQEFDLPTADEIKALIGWDDYKYDMGDGYDGQQLTGLTIIEDVVYDFDMDYDAYSITVTDIENADGSKKSKTYYAGYGETFDFSDLKATGTVNYDDGVFTAFSELAVPENIDLKKAIDTRMAAALENGVSLKANYVDNSVKATFTFTGIDSEDIVVTLRRGDIPSLAEVEAVVDYMGMALKDIEPMVGVINASTTYQVICGKIDGPDATITFEENGGSDVADITKVAGSLIGTLPTPERTGYFFDGWYTDEELETKFEERKMPEGGATLYAKWSKNEFTVTFDVNGGNNLDASEQTKTVIYGEAYGELPEATKSGSGFAGWFTEREGGEQIKADTLVNITSNQTLYAQWKDLKAIDRSVFSFGDAEAYTYERGVTREAGYDFIADGETYTEGDFTIKYKRQGNDDYETGLPINVGTYDVTVSRPADSVYAKFEENYTGVLTINKAVRPASDVELNFVDSGLTWIEFEWANSDDEKYDLGENATVIYNVIDTERNVTFSSDGKEAVVRNIVHSDSPFAASVTVVDPNYEDWTSNIDTTNWFVKSAPTTSWADNADTSWYNDTDTEFTITTAAQLAGFAALVDNKNKFEGKTVKLGDDIDLSGYIWTPIGNFYSATFVRGFGGTFDGQGYTISGLYVKEVRESTYGVSSGLFAALADDAVIKNVVIDDSFIYNGDLIGGIAGFATKEVNIINCTNYAVLFSDESSTSSMGGILGYSYDCDHMIVNCVNYGRVYCAGAKGKLSVPIVGGIVGNAFDQNSNFIANCANFGPVTGIYYVGGIIGRFNRGCLFNNYNVGKITLVESKNTIKVCGAITGYCGSVSTITGFVVNNHYLENSSEENSAVGELGSNKITFLTSSFTSPESQLKDTAGEEYAGKTLIEALNYCVEAHGGIILTKPVTTMWEATGPDGYPLPVGSYTSSLRK